MRIAVYTCAKNEAAFAERWAATTACADGRYWLVNNSDDDTLGAALAAGIDAHEVWLPDFRFDDARNMAMAMINPDEYDIAIQLDADEVFSEMDWRKHFDENPGHSRYSYWLDSGGARGWGKVRRGNAHDLTGAYRWRHAVHEVIEGPTATGHLDELTIVHRPDKEKSREYLLPLMEKWHAREPHDARLQFYLGREYCVHGQKDGNRQKAWDTLQAYVVNPKAWAPEVSEAYILLGNLQAGEHRENLYLKAVAACPTRREPWVYLARYYFDKAKEPDRAWGMCVEASHRNNDAIYTTHPGCWDEGFLNLKLMVGRKVGLRADAIKKGHTR